jgi:predicted ferric reductase
MRYAAWRKFHGATAVLFVITGIWHAITLGRHSDMTMTILMIVLTVCSVRFLLKNYFLLIFHKDGEA